jgi:hypothetical protein
MTSDTATIRAIASGEDAATTVVALLSRHYAPSHGDPDGYDFANADPLSLEHELRREFGPVSARTLVKVNAALALLARPHLFASSLGFFTAICSGLCGNASGAAYSPGTRTQTLMPPDADDILWSVVEAELLLGERMPSDFAPGIRRWVGMMLADEGFRMAPEALSWADYGKDDENRALKRSAADSELGRASAKLALERCDMLERGLAVRLGDLLERWRELGLARNGDSWFDSLVEGVDEQLAKVSGKSGAESTE